MPPVPSSSAIRIKQASAKSILRRDFAVYRWGRSKLFRIFPQNENRQSTLLLAPLDNPGEERMLLL